MSENEFLQNVATGLATTGTRLSIARIALVGPLDGDALQATIEELLNISDALIEAADTLNRARTNAVLASLGGAA